MEVWYITQPATMTLPTMDVDRLLKKVSRNVVIHKNEIYFGV